MRVGIDNTTNGNNDSAKADALADLIKNQAKKEETKFSDLSGAKKIGYIWDYYKWWFIGAIILVIVGSVLVRDYRENSKPMYLYVEMLNTYFGYDGTNTLYDDYVKASGVDLNKERLNIGMETMLSVDTFDTTMIAFQERLVANYSAGEIDVVIGPKEIIEGPANWDCYADFDKIIPQDLMDELKDREYEFYYFDPSADEVEDLPGEDLTPYCAGVYLDTCSYLNNMGEHGAYGVATEEKDRPVFTIASNSKRTDHAIEFLRFLIHNH